MLYAQNGIFGLNEAVDLGVDESYVGNTGALNSLIENVINEQKIFDGVMINEMTEANKILALKSARESGNIEQEAVAEQELIAFQEASLRDMANAVIAFIKKCAQKIKGLILSFVTKVGAVLIRDNKSLVSKYKSKVVGKDLSKLKYKWREPDNTAAPSELENINTLTSQTQNIVSSALNTDPDELSEKLTDSDYKDELLSKISKLDNASIKSFKKDFFDSHFESVSNEVGLKNDRLALIIQVLENSAKIIESFKKAIPKIDQTFNKIINSAKSAEGRANRNMDVDDSKEKAGKAIIAGKDIEYGGGTERSSSKAAKILNNIQKLASLISSIDTLVLKSEMNCVKFLVKQCRSVFVKAAVSGTYKAATESTYLDAVAEAEEYEFDSEMELIELN